mmetsp:Transcript_121862/g.344655  ORF Transcript_121862/g.344655 Transcript_121862/m.344655 type:complete len:250 (-) Transcript_121862:1153-1902(-)
MISAFADEVREQLREEVCARDGPSRVDVADVHAGVIEVSGHLDVGLVGLGVLLGMAPGPRVRVMSAIALAPLQFVFPLVIRPWILQDQHVHLGKDEVEAEARNQRHRIELEESDVAPDVDPRELGAVRDHARQLVFGAFPERHFVGGNDQGVLSAGDRHNTPVPTGHHRFILLVCQREEQGPVHRALAGFRLERRRPLREEPPKLRRAMQRQRCEIRHNPAVNRRWDVYGPSDQHRWWLDRVRAERRLQ